MGRKPRQWIPSLFYHVGSRGNRREPLYNDQEDYQIFFYIMKQVYEKHPFELASYCLMTNHYHLQIRSMEVPLSNIIGRINKRYADYFNKKNESSGHLFEKRFFDSVINTEEGMLKISQYIHLNPKNAQIVSSPHDYPYSSYSTILDPQQSHLQKYRMPYLNSSLLLNYFPGVSHEEKVRAYQNYVEGSGACHRPNYVE
ncbi:REP element-mobilizing transposase RayT [Natronobacillus azotifigens]|uniref:Transposase n=1 Tax=Natronobacillus azotifigens TaxID=472978 RepID=A0A9J6RBW1_9BACI|nr:transposase [Natronobacillus azotifigens]MCZ0703176.1 transposase [Natronobacillus azotifigens]